MNEEIQGQIDLLTSEMRTLRARFDELGKEMKQKESDRATIASEIVGRQKAIECLKRINSNGQKAEAISLKQALKAGG